MNYLPEFTVDSFQLIRLFVKHKEEREHLYIYTAL